MALRKINLTKTEKKTEKKIIFSFYLIRMSGSTILLCILFLFISLSGGVPTEEINYTGKLSGICIFLLFFIIFLLFFFIFLLFF